MIKLRNVLDKILSGTILSSSSFFCFSCYQFLFFFFLPLKIISFFFQFRTVLFHLFCKTSYSLLFRLPFSFLTFLKAFLLVRNAKLWAWEETKSVPTSKFVNWVSVKYPKNKIINPIINPLNPELNPICYLLALLGAHHFLHVSRIRVKSLTFRLLMPYIYIYIWSTHSWCF